MVQCGNLELLFTVMFDSGDFTVFSAILGGGSDYIVNSLRNR
jgi:hypothetical protein